MSTVLEDRPRPSTSPSPRRRWPRAALRTYLVAIILAATLPLALLMTFRIIAEGHQQRQALLDNLRGTAKAVAVGVERELGASRDTLLVLAQADTLFATDLQAFERRLRTRGPLRPSWERLAVIDSDGALLFEVIGEGRGAAPTGTAEIDALARAWVTQPADRLLVVSTLDASPTRRGTWIAVSATSSDGARHLLAARVELGVWQALLEGAAPRDASHLALFDGQRRVLARTRAPERFTGETLPADGVAMMALQASGAQKSLLLEGGETYVAWQLLQESDWGIGAAVASAEFDAAQQRAVLWTFGVAAACLLLGVTAALVVARRVASPLQRLLREGGTEADEPIEVTEIAQLREAFGVSEKARAEASARLAKKAQEFETLFRTCPIGLAFAQDDRCSQVLSNAAMEQIVPGAGVNAESDGLEVFSAGQRLGASEQPLAVAAREGRSVGATELEIRQRDRPSAFVLVSAVGLFDDAGAPRGAIASATDVTERKIAEHERSALMARERLARHDAQAANRAKDELLSMLGHELRNPLNAIVTSVEVLRRAPPDSATAESARAVVARQTRKLASMVDDLLDVGHVMADEITLQRQPLDLLPLVDAGVAAARARAGERRQRLTCDTARSVWVRADPRRITQVLQNLLDNAIKYTPTSGTVHVELRQAEGIAVLRVHDTGPGIAPELLARVFEPFVQGERELDRTAGGLGIGLTLVKRLVELHGGSIEARSSEEGSVFELRLQAIDPPDAAGPAASRRIGVIDDHPDALDGLRAMLELAGHAVSTAADGNAGLAMLLAQAPEVALVDIGLPGIDGLEIARRIRAAGFRGRLIALSGYGQQQDRERSRAAGFDAHLVKPIDPNLLLPLLYDT